MSLTKPSTMSIRHRLAASLLLAVFSLSALLSGCAGLTGTVAANSNGLLITEVMPSNTVTLQDDDGEYSDWIELYNAGSTSISLQGWYLSDNPNTPMQWEIPPVTLSPGEYMVIFASGKNRFDSTKNIYHAGFRLSSNGETLTLYSSELGTVQAIELAPAKPDISYGMIMTDGYTGEYAWFATPTPGAHNTDSYAAEISQLPSSAAGLVINEYMTDNASVIYDSDGDYCDWVELYNSTGHDINLYGCSLSDDPADPEKWTFPEGCTIPAGGYLLVFLSGKDKLENGEVHAGFRLSSSDTELLLCDSLTRIIDRTPIIFAKRNISVGRTDSGEWEQFAKPTPGEKNHGTSFSAL